jgi:hypothetical protein
MLALFCNNYDLRRFVDYPFVHDWDRIVSFVRFNCLILLSLFYATVYFSDVFDSFC